MQFVETELHGLRLIEPDVFHDARGFFKETYHRRRYRQAAGIDAVFVQDNLSRSSRGVLRGLHYQVRHPQAKLIQVLCGEIFDVSVDLRRGSPTFGRWAGFTLSGENHRQLYIPEGFVHGFAVISATALVHYKCSRSYRPEDEAGVLWCDADLNIQWPCAAPVVSAKDRGLPLLSAIPRDSLPRAADPQNG